MEKLLHQIKEEVCELLKKEDSGHNKDHIIRVYNLAMKFTEQEEANKLIVGLASLLHDVDDYKIVGKEQAEQLFNAKNIMNKYHIDLDIQNKVLEIIKTMGYSKLLRGIRPVNLEGKIVSDADMCDAIGSSGIIRSIVYSVSSKGNGVIFDKLVWPNVNITAQEYNNQGTTYETDNAINHFFEKLLKLKDLMMTESGKKEAINRQKIMIDFLEQFFIEENVFDWSYFLEEYLIALNSKENISIRSLQGYTKNV